MRRSLHLDLTTAFGPPIADPPPIDLPRVPIRDASCRRYVGAPGSVHEQEFDGRYGYLYTYDLVLADEVCLPVQVDDHDIHILYLMEGDQPIVWRDQDGALLYSLEPGRARYMYLPPGRYSLSCSTGQTLLFGFYFDVGIFRQGSERSFGFLNELLEAYRERAAVPHYSIDFNVGPDIAYRIAHLCLHIRRGDLDNEYFILEALSRLIKLSRDTIFEEYEQISAEQVLATKAHDLLIDLVHQHGQECKMEEVARILDRHVDYINHLHQRYYSLSLSQQKYETLIEIAREQLRSSDRISDAAYACGYSSPAAFARFFRRYTGLSPTEFLLLQNNA